MDDGQTGEKNKVFVRRYDLICAQQEASCVCVCVCVCVTDLLVGDLHSSLAYFMMIAYKNLGCWATTNTHTFTHTHTHTHSHSRKDLGLKSEQPLYLTVDNKTVVEGALTLKKVYDTNWHRGDMHLHVAYSSKVITDLIDVIDSHRD